MGVEIHYMDHAGTTLPSEELIATLSESLVKDASWMANPHSGHSMAQKTQMVISNARERILGHFGVDSSTYSVVFTANTTAALKLVAECFDFGEVPNALCERSISSDLRHLLDDSKSILLMLADSHTSVVGMRQLCRTDRILVTDFDQLRSFLAQTKSNRSTNQTEPTVFSSKRRNLFVLTAMSNFCGRKYDLEIVNEIRQSSLGTQWSICIDAASFVAHSNKLCLNETLPDFVTFSFYKIFGFPTGLGALLIRRNSQVHLKKHYFGGGTVNSYSPFSGFTSLRQNVESKFEDGTVNFHGIAALKYAFEDLDKFGGIDVVGQNVISITVKVWKFLQFTRHCNGAPLAVIYGKEWARMAEKWEENNNEIFYNQIEKQGPILNFNLLRSDGSFVGASEVSKIADLFGIQLRTGCHCNIGACASHLGLDDHLLLRSFEMGKICGDDLDLVDGRPSGSVRISFGRRSTTEDIEVFEKMIRVCFLEDGHHHVDFANLENLGTEKSKPLGRLTHIFIYPVKSCGPFPVVSWKLYKNEGGLIFDRLWMIASPCNSIALTQKRFPTLCSIVPEIDLAQNELVLRHRSGSVSDLKLPLDVADYCTKAGKSQNNCAYRNGPNYLNFGGKEATNWLGKVHPSLEGTNLVVHLQDNGGESTSFANKSDFLLLTRSSVKSIAEFVELPIEDVLQRFRPNFVIDLGPESPPFTEDSFKTLSIGRMTFEVIGLCTRCQMICINQNTGEKDQRILIALKMLRQGKLTFGIYLKQKPNDGKEVQQEVCVGSVVTVTM